jgi:hypothetical protein
VSIHAHVAVGIAMVIGGSAWYSAIRYAEMQARKHQPK